MEQESIDKVANEQDDEIVQYNRQPYGSQTYLHPGYVKRPVDTKHIMRGKFLDFIENEWDMDYMYTPSDFIYRFGITRHLARYYLMKMVYDKVLYRVKYLNKTWYDKVEDEHTNAVMKEYVWMGVKVSN